MSRLYDRNFAIAFAAQTAFTVTNSMLSHFARWVKSLGGDQYDIGLVASCATIVGLISRPILAPWIDRIGPRACWCLAGVAVTAGLLGNLAIHEVGPMLLILRSITAIGIAVVFASGLTYIAHTTPFDRRTEAIGVLGAGGFAGLLIGPWIGDMCLAGERTRESFVAYFWFAAGGVLLSMLLVACTRPCPPHEEKPSAHPMQFFRAMRRYWPGPILGVTLAFGTCMSVIFVFLADFVDQHPNVRLWWFFVTYATTGLSIRLGLRNWPDRFGAKPVLAAGMGLFTLGMVMFLFVSEHHPYSLLVPGIICGAAHGVTFHAMVSTALAPFPPAARGAGSTLALMGIDLGTFLSSQIIGLLGGKGNVSYDFVFLGTAVFCIASTVYFIIFSKGKTHHSHESMTMVRDQEPVKLRDA